MKSTRRIDLRNNREGAPGSLFVDAAAGHLRLVRKEARITDARDVLNEVREDLDRKARGKRPDLGAYELSPE